MSDQSDRAESSSDDAEEIVAELVEPTDVNKTGQVDHTLSLSEPADHAIIRDVPPVQSEASPDDDATIANETMPIDRPLTTDSANRPGAPLRRFANYELVKEIARGGMGIVYLARQPALNRTVALKMILAGEFAGSESVQRFHAEAEAAAQLDHPCIVPIYDVGESAGQHYFAMAYVDGPSLAAMATEQPFYPHEACNVMQKIAGAIHYAHERGIIHRDLKPQNILMDQDNQPRVTDFGLAKRIEGNDSDLTGTGQILGTPSYMPPEQAGGAGKYLGPTADVYSLGAILYFLLVGRPPFQSASAVETLLQVIEQEPAEPRKLNTNIPRDLETICLKCLEKDPARRYQSAQAFEADLKRFANEEPILARPPGIMGRTFRWLNRRSFASGLMAFLVGLLLIAGGIMGLIWAVSFGATSIHDAFNETWQASLVLPMEDGDDVTSERFFVNPDQLHAVRLKAEIRTKSIYEKAPIIKGDEPDYQPQFNIPMRVEVIDENGSIIHSDSARLAWNSGFRQSFGEEFNASKDIATIQPVGFLGTFRGPATGPVHVHLIVEEDPMYLSTIDAMELHIFEDVRDNAGDARFLGALCVSSPIIMLLGLGLLIYGPLLMRRQKKRKAI